MACCKLTKYSVREVTLSTLAMLVFSAAGLLWLPPWAAAIIVAIMLAVWGWVLWFFRDPDRPTPTEPGAIISPADGTVTDITPLGAGSMLGRDGVQIGIFMSVFSVHVNRSPVDGVIDHVDHVNGAFLDARDPAASQRNEAATIYMHYTHNGQTWPIVFRQIAGLIARRIITDITSGQAVKRGERIGMIKFGSRMEVLVPVELVGEVCVKIGQKVQAGLTVLAKSGSK
ncbi:MAG: phosphatidylserine decarboxylase family protein [Planctomycetaceae bacterium]|nr:MAG: phosphatidylserine decarboxylase family protein [Planctomycetaceae bacterium]